MTSPAFGRHVAVQPRPPTVGDVGRYTWHPTVVPAPAPAPGALRGRAAAVVGGCDEDRSAVAAALAAAGACPVPVEPPRTGEDPCQAADRAGATLAAAGPVDVVVDLNLCHVGDGTRPTPTWRAALAQTVAAVQAVYDDWAAEADARRCAYLAVTRLGGRMGYDGNGIREPLGGVWAGLAKSLPHELPACRVGVLDVADEAPAALAQLVVTELGAVDYFEVGWREGVRTTLACRREDVADPRLRLRPADVVLVSGGARGIGFELATRLAADHGCRVVVTGRRPLPVDEPWLAMDDAAFAAYQRRCLAAAAGGDLAGARRAGAVRAGDRESATNLAGARRRGLPIDYEACDVTDPEQVDRLVRRLGADLRVVVHNAGIAAPVRLRRKDISVVLDVVGCKVDGFVNLARALAGHDLDLFCNVGSAAGRLGGMIGQVDYAAANEALTRLGFWAGSEQGMPVTTLAFTTWDRVGLIANFDAALRYGTALPVEEGVDRWTRELLAAAPGEVMFLGRVGTALVPSQLAGFRKFDGHPDHPRLHSLHHYLGELERYRPFRDVRSRVRLRAGHPWASAVTLAGAAVLPTGIALEYAVSVGEWVCPQGWPPRRLRELRDVDVQLDALVLRDGALTLRCEGTGSRVDGDWCVDVEVSRADDARPVLRTRLVYDEGPPPDPEGATAQPRVAVQGADGRARLLNGRRDGLAWSAGVLPQPAWRADGDRMHAAVPPTRPADLWTLPTPPHHALPTNAVEAVVAAVATAATKRPRALRLDRLRLLSEAAEARVETDGRGRWTVRAGCGAPVLRIDGVVLR